MDYVFNVWITGVVIGNHNRGICLGFRYYFQEFILAIFRCSGIILPECFFRVPSFDVVGDKFLCTVLEIFVICVYVP